MTDYWQQRWAAGRIGFHRQDPHPFLLEHLPVLGHARRVYVPLCGKSVDLRVLRRPQCQVFGSELVPQAVAELFHELGETPNVEDRPPFRAHSVDGLCVLEGDAFALERHHLGGEIDAVYDRGALVAVEPRTRPQYVATAMRVLARGGRMLLITLVYDQSKAPGPPWSIDGTVVRALFEPHGRITQLGEQPDAGSPGLRAAGVKEFVERAYLIERQ